MKRIVVCLSASGLVLALALPALAHNMEVKNPKTGETVTEQWIGGFLLPEPAQDAPPMFGPFRLPPSHAHGLVMACHGTANSGAVTISAPPFYSGCVHGQP
jgi:hypothetical protein